MADFLKVMSDTLSAEHTSIDNFLHKNAKEKTYTFMGVYPYTKLKSHKKIDAAIAKTRTLKEASRLLSKDEDLYQEVLGFYYLGFWHPMWLDFMESDHKATEIMVFIINVGIGRKKKAIRGIQKIVGVKDDGQFGPVTMGAVNSYDEDKFSKQWDMFEIDFYNRLVILNPRLEWAKNGWHRRSRLV